MKDKLINALIIVLIALAVWQVFRFVVSKEAAPLVLPEESGYSKDFNLFNDGRQFPLHNILNYRGEILAFDSIANDIDIFVYMDMAGCPPCRDLTFSELDKLKDGHPEARICALVNSISRRDMYVMEKESKSRYIFYMVDSIPFSTLEDGEEILSPVLFQIDSIGRIYNCYMVQQNNKDGLIEYLASITAP